MTPSQRRAYDALDLGPRWAPRTGSAPVPAGVVVEAAADAAIGVPSVAVAAVAADATGALDTVGVPAAGTAGGDVATLSWDALRSRVASCTDCGLCRSRTQTVFGIGPVQASWMLVGEAPGAEEDARGEPFVGQAGRLLDAMLAAIGLNRAEHVFIANVLKCRPPGNRNPEPGEVARCEPYLARQVELIRPRLIVVMGRFAAQSLLRTDASIASLRNRVHQYRIGEREVPVVVTYHPAYLLRTPQDKAKAWVDLCLAQRIAAQSRDD